MEDNVVNLDEAKTLDQLKKELAAQQRETKAAILTVQKLLKDLNAKNEEIKSLQEMLTKTAQVIQPVQSKKDGLLLDITSEEEIAVKQLERLRQLANTRALTLEETKIYDLLVKNKRLSRDETTVNLSKEQYRHLDASQLIQIAGQKNDPAKGD